MRRALTLLFVLLLPLLAAAQPPAPVGGDMSNTTTKATGSSTPRKLADRAANMLNPLDFGAIGDGASHLLTAGASLLASCPELTAPVETDACAMQAALDLIATRTPVAGIAYGSPGGTISVPDGITLKLGTQSLAINKVSLTLKGEDQYGSAILVGANPMLNFGLNNGIGVGAAQPSTTGAAFAVGDVLTLSGLGGTCEDPPVITVNSVGTVGEIVTSAITHAGSCSVIPTNPIDYLTNGSGYGATFNTTWTGTAMTGATLVQTTGTGCANGETLTAVGGSTPGGSPTPLVMTVTNAIGGLIQKNGVSITNPGSYGTPPPNPVSVTASGGCTGAGFNIARLTNNGGMLTLKNLNLQADGPGVSVLKAQFNLPIKSTVITDLVMYAAGTNYWGAGFDLTSMTNSYIARIDAHNNLTYANSNPSAALFVVRSQNNLLGHYEHYWDHIGTYAFTGGAIDYIATAQDTQPYQGQKFSRIICGIGMHCLRLENASPRAYGNILIDDLYATQTVQQIEIKKGLAIIIKNSNFGIGTTRMTSLPSSVDEVVLDSVNQWILRGNYCSSALTVIPTVTCFHIMGTSAFGLASGNIITNPAHVPTETGYVFDSTTALNTAINDYFGCCLTPVINTGTSNTFGELSQPCTFVDMSTASPYTIPNGVSCVYFSNALLAAGTVIMPANPGLNQVIRFTSFSNITTLTVQANTGQVMGAGMPTTITPGTPFAVKNVSFRWQRI